MSGHAAQGVKNAVPKTILQLMNVEGMTRENVASHLQKYRLYLKRMAGYPPAARLPLDTLQQVQQVPLLPAPCHVMRQLACGGQREPAAHPPRVFVL